MHGIRSEHAVGLKWIARGEVAEVTEAKGTINRRRGGTEAIGDATGEGSKRGGGRCSRRWNWRGQHGGGGRGSKRLSRTGQQEEGSRCNKRWS